MSIDLEKLKRDLEQRVKTLQCDSIRDLETQIDDQEKRARNAKAEAFEEAARILESYELITDDAAQWLRQKATEAREGAK